MMMGFELLDEPFVQHVKQHKKAKAEQDSLSQNSQSVEDSMSESDSGCHSKQGKGIYQQEIDKVHSLALSLCDWTCDSLGSSPGSLIDVVVLSDMEICLCHFAADKLCLSLKPVVS